MRKWLFMIPLGLAAMFCTIGAPAATPTQDLSAMVHATLTAIAAAPPVPANGATAVPGRDFIPPLGAISGTLSYPASALPRMRIAAFDVKTGAVSYSETALGQNSYTFELPAGTYHIVAYSLAGDGFPGGMAGGYTRAVPCGLSASCTDHALIDVTVSEGVSTPNINPRDWYAPEGSFPPMPTP